MYSSSLLVARSEMTENCNIAEIGTQITAINSVSKVYKKCGKCVYIRLRNGNFLLTDLTIHLTI